MFIFGGHDKNKQASNKLYLVTPAYDKNKKFISHKGNGTFKKLVKPKVYYEVKEI